IVAWQDQRNGSYDIYAQRLDGSGTSQWAFAGVALCSASGDQVSPVLCSDGAGGAIVAWLDRRTGGSDVYAERVTGAGVAQWTLDGVAVCTVGNDQLGAVAVPDGSGGAIIVWQDIRNGSNWDIYGQRLNQSGVAQWSANGLPLCVASGSQQYPVAVPDGSGGVIAAWQDERSGGAIYSQRVNTIGVALWSTD